MKIKFTTLILAITILFGFKNTSNAQVWSKSFTAGDFDSDGKLLGGSEVLQLIGHKKKLFASIGYWQDENNVWYGGANLGIGWGQIIRLDKSNGQWQEDFTLGANFLRPEILKQLI